MAHMLHPHSGRTGRPNRLGSHTVASRLLVCTFVAVVLAALPSAGQSTGVSPRFAEARQSAQRLSRLHTLLVSRRGEVVFEYYARGQAPTRLANIKSASKSLISALVGIAIDRKLIASVREPIVGWFPELRRDPDPRKARITIEDLLTMRSGLGWMEDVRDLGSASDPPHDGVDRAWAALLAPESYGLQESPVLPRCGKRRRIRRWTCRADTDLL